MNTIKKIILLFCVTTSFVACKDDETSNIDNKFTSEIDNIVDNVILSTYKNLDEKAGDLVTALGTLNNARTQANLEAGREAWRATRIPWEQSEGFLFGPVDAQGLDPAMDSWPVNVEDLNAVLNSSDNITKSYLDALEGTVKGFHTLEWLLFGLNGDKPVSELTDRQFQYLQACAQSLKGATSQLYNAWKEDGGNFGAIVKTAGQAGNNTYISQKVAIQEFKDGMLLIADEVGNGKIDEPFSSENLLFEESRFSANSKADFANNMRSIQNIYLGGVNGSTGPGLSSIVKEKNNALDAELKTAISEAINAIEAIPGTFSDAVFNNKVAVSNAQDKVKTLETLIKSKLEPLINSL